MGLGDSFEPKEQRLEPMDGQDADGAFWECPRCGNKDNVERLFHSRDDCIRSLAARLEELESR